MQSNKKIYAITGGIGCGKTAVSQIIRKEGYPVFSCDEIYAALVRGGKMVRAIEREFSGVTAADGSLDRQKLSAKVFGNPAALQKLERITHPAILDGLFRLASESESSTVFCEVPLFFEAGLQNRFDGAIVVVRKKKKRVQAVIERSGISREEVLARINSQFDYSSADLSGYYIVTNDGNIDDLAQKVKKILQNIANLT